MTNSMDCLLWPELHTTVVLLWLWFSFNAKWEFIKDNYGIIDQVNVSKGNSCLMADVRSDWPQLGQNKANRDARRRQPWLRVPFVLTLPTCSRIQGDSGGPGEPEKPGRAGQEQHLPPPPSWRSAPRLSRPVLVAPSNPSWESVPVRPRIPTALHTPAKCCWTLCLDEYLHAAAKNHHWVSLVLHLRSKTL